MDQPETLLVYVEQLVILLRDRVCPAVQQADSAAIHQARVCTRRLKAAADLLAPVLSKRRARPFQRVLRKIRRRLGPLRDLDVMIGHLERPPLRVAEAAAWARQCLERQRDELREQIHSQVAAGKLLTQLGAWWGLRPEVEQAATAIDALLSQSLHEQLSAFAEQADRLIGKRPLPAGQHLDAHELRIAGKALRYTLEMGKAHGHKLPGRVFRVFKKLQDHLGLWHDDVVLTERIMRLSLDQLLAHHDAGMQKKVLDLAAHTLRGAQQQLDRFGAQWREHGESLDSLIRQAFPLIASTPPRKSTPPSTSTTPARSTPTTKSTPPTETAAPPASPETAKVPPVSQSAPATI